MEAQEMRWTGAGSSGVGVCGVGGDRLPVG